MKKILIIGGGIAGISLAVFLAKNKIKSILIEASPKIGGRAFSFKYKNGITIDNGQHAIFKCYKNTLNYLEIIKAKEFLEARKKLDFEIIDLKKGENKHNLYVPSFPPFINLLSALIKFKGYNLKDKLKTIRLFARSLFLANNDLKNISFNELLLQLDFFYQSRFIIEPLLVSAFNSNLEDISAFDGLKLLKKFFFSGFESYIPYFSNVGLSDLFYANAISYLLKSGCQINMSEKAIEIKVNKNKVCSIVSNKNVYDEFDNFVFAVPFHSLQKIKGADYLLDLNDYYFDYSPIVAGHVFLDEKNNPFKNKVFSLVNSEIDWIFGKPFGFSFVKSAAFDLVKKSDEEIIREIEKSAKSFDDKFLLPNKEDIFIFKEKRATIKSKINLKKPTIVTKISNAFLCGDWIDCGFPPTIESAIASANKVAQKIA